MVKNMQIKSILMTNISIMCLLILLAIIGNRSIYTINEQIAVKNCTCVIIDAGHGGIDGGAVSCTGLPESKFNMDIALCLNDMLQLLGIETKMVRKTDISIHTKGESIAAKKVSDLQNRVKIVNETDNALLISIHQNHFPDQRYNGPQVFYAKTSQSEIIGKEMQNLLVKTLKPDSNRKAKQASGIYLLKNIINPGILIECGFLSNPQEEAKLKDPEYQKKLCAVIASEVSTFICKTYTA